MDKKNNKSAKLALSCDLGGSQTKVIAQIYPDGIPLLITMSPEVADVSFESVKHLNIESGAIDAAWVGLGDEYYVLGRAAKNNFAGTADLKALKYQYALPKLAAILWIACTTFNIKNPNLMIYLLLPSGESSDGERLSKRLTELLLQGINTPTGVLKAKLRNFYVSPEGAGVLSYRMTASNKLYLQKSIGILMLGYRNSSFFLCDRGNKGKSETTDLGMSWMVQQFVERTSVGLSKDDFRLVEALVLAGSGNNAYLRSLSRKSKNEEVEADLALFEQVLPVVRDEYCRALKRWINNIAVFDEVLICGGTAAFVRNELTNYFKGEGITIIWNGNVDIPQSLDTKGLGERLADVWASHINHINMLDLNFKYDRKQPLIPEPSPIKTTTYEAQLTRDRWKNFLPMTEP